MGGSQPWMERMFQKRDCIRFIPSKKDVGKCCCGQSFSDHEAKGIKDLCAQISNDDHWNAMRHTLASSTNAYGTIEFQGASHPLKAKYARVSFDAKAETILQLLTKEWNLELPKLLISVHGGKANFELQNKLKSVLQKGLVKAAKTTGAWIMTGGTNTGVMRHVGESLQIERSPRLRERVVTMGIAPWGIIENRRELIGHNVVVPYYSISSPKSRFSALNNHHSYFILADNGTVGRYGAEIVLRKKLERHISKQKIYKRYDNSSCGVPVVCVVIEGGVNTIRTVLEYVTDSPPVPVVICDGTGRSADLLAFAHKHLHEDDPTLLEVQQRLLRRIEQIFELGPEQSEQIYIELLQCVRRRDLITVFRMGEEDCEEFDQAILTALLNGHHLAKPDQLSLALTWNSSDLARREIFVYGVDWPAGSLEQAMMDALNCTIQIGPTNTLLYLVRDIKKHMPRGYRYQLYDIGLVIEKLMGGRYRSSYCRRKFRKLYNAIMNVSPKISPSSNTSKKTERNTFDFPFNDLLIWAVLMKRQNMALFMWKRGEEAVAKALLACKLYKAMAEEAAEDDLETEIFSEMRANASAFEVLALELLDYCYRQDDDVALQLLTHELQNWSKQTCLSLAVIAKNHSFLAHPAAQMLVGDLWMGGLRIRKTSNLKVILGLLFPLTILTLRFKSKEELELMPQTEEEHRLEKDDDTDEDSIKSGSRILPSPIRETPKVGNSLPGMIRHHQFTLSKCDSCRSLHRMENGKVGNIEVLQETENQELNSSQKQNSLKLGKKIHEFYAAPITKFWGHSIAFLIFLSTFTYVVLVKTTMVFSWPEVYTIAYHGTFGIEKLREVFFSEPKKLSHKFIVWIEKKWNPADLSVVLFFFVGLSLRCESASIPSGRVFYCLAIMYWYIRVLDILSVNKYLGPFVTMIGKMVVNMLYFLVLLLLVLMSYGVARQGILKPNEEPSWALVRHIFFMPYWMLYGEVFADSIDVCDGDIDDITCQVGAWINPAIMAIYLLIANLLLINLLIAVFNNIFMEVSAVSQQLWKSQRYRVVIEYEQKPVLPPPLILLSHMVLLWKYCMQRYKGKTIVNDHGLKLFLSESDTEKINDFEEECVEGYLNEKEMELKTSTAELTRVTSDRVENITMKVEDNNDSHKKAVVNMDSLKFQLKILHDHVQDLREHLLNVAGSNKDDSNDDDDDNNDDIAKNPGTTPSQIRRSSKFAAYFPETEHNVPVVIDSSSSFYEQGNDEDDQMTDLPRVPRRQLSRKSFRKSKCSPEIRFSKRQMSIPKETTLMDNETSEASFADRSHRKLRGKSMSEVENSLFINRDAPRNLKVFRSNSTMSHGRFANMTARNVALLHRRPSYNDYTSITDDLEEEVVAKIPSGHATLLPLPRSNSLEHEQAIAMEKEILHGAEEADYYLMEGLIQRRLRKESELVTGSFEDLCSHASFESETEVCIEPSGTNQISPGSSKTSILINEDDSKDQRAKSPHLLHPNWSETKF